MIRLSLAVFLAAVVQFGWGFAFWTMTPISKQMIGSMPDEEKVTQALKEANPETGVYFLPYGDCQAMSGDEEAMAAFAERHRAGPLVQVIYRKEGIEPMSPAVFAMGFAHMVGSCLLAGGLLLLAAPALPGYFARFFFVVGLGAFAVFAIQLANPVWFHHPWKFSLLHSFFELVSWVLAGIILAAFLRRAE